mmetsp:Transcript_21544/g.48633  ORF Transcript_21544/g.48633 Transcript_21544/m.48633 type:complete len:498 (+) Transcript_21544:792-2285(+)
MNELQPVSQVFGDVFDIFVVEVFYELRQSGEPTLTKDGQLSRKLHHPEVFQNIRMPQAAGCLQLIQCSVDPSLVLASRRLFILGRHKLHPFEYAPRRGTPAAPGPGHTELRAICRPRGVRSSILTDGQKHRLHGDWGTAPQGFPPLNNFLNCEGILNLPCFVVDIHQVFGRQKGSGCHSHLRRSCRSIHQCLKPPNLRLLAVAQGLRCCDLSFALRLHLRNPGLRSPRALLTVVHDPRKAVRPRLLGLHAVLVILDCIFALTQRRQQAENLCAAGILNFLQRDHQTVNQIANNLGCGLLVDLSVVLHLDRTRIHGAARGRGSCLALSTKNKHRIATPNIGARMEASSTRRLAGCIHPNPQQRSKVKEVDIQYRGSTALLHPPGEHDVLAANRIQSVPAAGAGDGPPGPFAVNTEPHILQLSRRAKQHEVQRGRKHIHRAWGACLSSLLVAPPHAFILRLAPSAPTVDFVVHNTNGMLVFSGRLEGVPGLLNMNSILV